MAEEKQDPNKPQGDTGLNPIEEARRIAEGKSLAEAQAEKAADMAEFPEIMKDLGKGINEYTQIVANRNHSESDRLTTEYSQPLVEAEQRLDAALAQTTENPKEDVQRAWDEYEGVRAQVREGVLTRLMEMNGFMPSSGDRPPDTMAGYDLIPDLFLAKMTPVLNRRDFHGAKVGETPEGNAMYEALKKPRVVPEAELQRLTRQTMIGWYQFQFGITGMELPLKQAEGYADHIIKMVNDPPAPKK